jgi:hypothetical protein
VTGQAGGFDKAGVFKVFEERMQEHNFNMTFTANLEKKL